MQVWILITFATFSRIINLVKIHIRWENIVEIETEISLAETTRCQKLFNYITVEVKRLMIGIMKIKKKTMTIPEVGNEKEKEDLYQYLFLHLNLYLEFLSHFFFHNWSLLNYINSKYGKVDLLSLSFLEMETG